MHAYVYRQLLLSAIIREALPLRGMGENAETHGCPSQIAEIMQQLSPTLDTWPISSESWGTF